MADGHHDAQDEDRPLLLKILTVSDGVVHGTRDDTSGPILEEHFIAAGWSVIERAVTEDGEGPVADALRRLADGFHGLVVTTGGTGFGPRDRTPEGTRAVIDREAPGLAEAMRLVSPLGRLSRAVAGTRDRALIVNTPGSSKGCVETIDAVIDVLPHAVRLLVDNADPHPAADPHPGADVAGPS
jgi:molybdenum cofactor synthesis domain-containing protein